MLVGVSFYTAHRDADTSDFQITGVAWDPNQHNATHASADDLVWMGGG